MNTTNREPPSNASPSTSVEFDPQRKWADVRMRREPSPYGRHYIGVASELLQPHKSLSIVKRHCRRSVSRKTGECDDRATAAFVHPADESVALDAPPQSPAPVGRVAGCVVAAIAMVIR